MLLPLALVVLWQLPVLCGTPLAGSDRVTRSCSFMPQVIGVRGGGGYSGLPDEQLLDEPRSAAELWKHVYSRHGVVTLCNVEGFDPSTADDHLIIERGGACVRNGNYGYGCASSAAVAAEAGSAQIFYFEAQLVGGVSPVEGVTQVAVPAEMRAQVGGMETLDMQAFIEATGTRGCAIGVVEDSCSQLVHAAHMPLNSMVWLQQGSLGGGIRVPRAADGQASRLGALGLHDSPPDATLRLQSGDRLGVLVDYREGKIGFVRNGTFVHQLTQAFECRGLLKKQRKFQEIAGNGVESTGLGASGCLAQTLDDSDDLFEHHTSDRRFDDIAMTNKKTEANTETDGHGRTSSYGDDSDTPLPWSVTDGGRRIDGPRLAPWQRAAMRACPSSAAPAPAGIGRGMQAGACGGMAFRFVVASLRKNTTWTVTSADECRESLSHLDWRRWRREVTPNAGLDLVGAAIKAHAKDARMTEHDAKRLMQAAGDHHWDTAFQEALQPDDSDWEQADEQSSSSQMAKGWAWFNEEKERDHHAWIHRRGRNHNPIDPYGLFSVLDAIKDRQETASVAASTRLAGSTGPALPHLGKARDTLQQLQARLSQDLQKQKSKSGRAAVQERAIGALMKDSAVLSAFVETRGGQLGLPSNLQAGQTGQLASSKDPLVLERALQLIADKQARQVSFADRLRTGSSHLGPRAEDAAGRAQEGHTTRREQERLAEESDDTDAIDEQLVQALARFRSNVEKYNVTFVAAEGDS